MKIPAYSKYKASGVEWLGEVPAHWTVERSDKRVTTTKRQVVPDAFSGLEVFHYSIPVVQELGTGAVEDGETIASAKQVIDTPIVLVSRLNPRKATICRATPHEELLTLASTEFVALQPTTGDIRFLEYLASSEVFRQRLDSWVQSVTRSHQRARPEEIYRFWSAWPDPVEQRAIADFLDRETAKIDALIAKKRTLIERLQEKRTALISRTVTRGLPPAAARAAGLDPNPKLKPSGIDWLGDVPQHWAVKKLGHVATVVRGASPRPAGDLRYFEGDFIPWITVGELTKDTGMHLTSTETMLTQEGAALSRVIAQGTLVLTNSGATLGVPKVLSITGCANDGVVAFENLHPDASNEFLYYYLTSLTDNLRDRIKQGSGQPNLNTDIVRALDVPLPPPIEQRAIASLLAEELSRHDAVVAGVGAAIERLQEYRTALITAAVTGKIDVRSQPTGPGSSAQSQVRTPEGARRWR